MWNVAWITDNLSNVSVSQSEFVVIDVFITKALNQYNLSVFLVPCPDIALQRKGERTLDRLQLFVALLTQNDGE